jgi:hypothetical protein
MTPNPNEHTCTVCHQRFNSENELREHQRSAHEQQKRGGQSISEPEEQSNQGQPKRDKIA